MNLEMKLENGWVIVVEQDNTSSVMVVDDGKNHSKTLVWAYHSKITNYPKIKDSGLSPYKSKGYRLDWGVSQPTGFLWANVELMKYKIEKQFS